jgi:hypothetical protein
MAKRRKTTDRRTDWMRAVVFNSLLILMPVVAFQILRSAYAGQTYFEEPTMDAIAQTKRNIDRAFVSLAASGDPDREAFWHERIARELDAGDVAAARGFLIAAPEMLDRSAAKALRAAAAAEPLGSEDARLEAAAARKLPADLAQRYEEARRSELSKDTPAPTPVPAPGAGDGAPLIVSATRPDNDRRFELLGSYPDLVNRTQRWIDGDAIDTTDLKIVGLGLIAADTATQANDARIRAASILRSAHRSRRLTQEFRDYITLQLDTALPDDRLRPRAEVALEGLATTDVKVERIKAAFTSAIDAGGLRKLERELAHIDQIGKQTSPSAAIHVLGLVKDGGDLRRARLVADAGGDRMIALIKESGPLVLSHADMSVNWTARVILQIMGLTAAAAVVFWVVVLSARHNLRARDPPRVDPH